MKKERLLIILLIFVKSLYGQKNVVLITVDDLNDWVGVFGGHPQAYTPNIDKLAQKGVTFQNASCSSPVCNPSRTALMTGRRPHETGYDNNAGANNAKHFRDNPNNWIKNLTTMPQYFGEQGYKTVSKGKLFHQPNESIGEFQTVGPNGQGANAGPDKELISNTDGKLTWSESNQKLLQTGDYSSADYGANFLNQNHNKPFFMGIGIFRPHIPLFAPKEFYDLVPRVDDIILPPLYKANDRNDTYGGSNNYRTAIMNNGGERRWKEWTRAYLANIAFADACVGHLLNALENSAYANNTIVVLVGDHGWHMGEKDHVLKFTLWERAIKTPLIIYDPSMGAGDCNKAVSLQDIFPTLIELTGLKEPGFTIRGRSLKRLVENPSASWCGAALTTYSGSNSLRSDRYRYIKYKNGKEELYDHLVDPGEWNNLEKSSDHSQVLKEMREGMMKMLNFNENPFGNSCPADGTSCENIDTDKDGTNDCNDQCPFDPNKIKTGNCGCNKLESSCSVITPANISSLVVSLENCNKTTLTWEDVEGEDSYRVRRKIIGESTFSNIADLGKDIVTYQDNNVQENTTYVYMVRPMQNGGAVAISNQPEINTGLCVVTALNDSSKGGKLIAFPNPTSADLTLNKEVYWTLKNVSGVSLISGFGTYIDLTSFPTGFYILSTNNGDRLRLVKKIK